MKGAKDGGAMVVRRHVRPGWNTGVSNLGGIEETSPAEGEDDVAEDGGATLEAREYLIQEPSPERTSVGDGCETSTICGDKVVQSGVLDVLEGQLLHKGLELGRGG